MRVEGRVSSISSYLTTEAIGDENFIKETNKTKKDPNEITTDDILLRRLLAPRKSLQCCEDEDIVLFSSSIRKCDIQRINNIATRVTRALLYRLRSWSTLLPTSATSSCCLPSWCRETSSCFTCALYCTQPLTRVQLAMWLTKLYYRPIVCKFEIRHAACLA
jgi:hypothetical protein